MDFCLLLVLFPCRRGWLSRASERALPAWCRSVLVPWALRWPCSGWPRSSSTPRGASMVRHPHCKTDWSLAPSAPARLLHAGLLPGSMPLEKHGTPCPPSWSASLLHVHPRLTWRTAPGGAEISSISGDGSTASADAPAVSSLDSQQCATMHDLRKKIRGELAITREQG